MKKKLFALVLTALLALPVYADTLFLMKPVVKEIDKSDADKITAAIESAVTSNYNTITYRDLPKGKINKLGKCGMKAECWVEKAEDEDFQYVLLSLVAMNEDEEIKVRFVLISLEDEDVVEDNSKVYDDVDSVSEKRVNTQVKKVLASVAGSLKGKKKKNSELEKRMKKEEEREAREEAARQKKLEEERQKREAELERQRREEERLEKERKRKQKLQEERERKAEEAELARLEKERERREAEKKKERASKKQSLKNNAEKLERGRELVLEMCAQGKYNAAIKAIVKVSETKCECEEDAKVLALKTQLLNFNKVREQILKGVEVNDSSLILDNIEAAKALDESIVSGGTEFSQKVDKYAAVGYLARGREMEKADDYVAANEAYEKCLEIDSEKTECSDWIDQKDKVVKKIYDKAAVMKNFNPTKAKELLRSILKIVTAENEYYKKAEADLHQLEY